MAQNLGRDSDAILPPGVRSYTAAGRHVKITMAPGSCLCTRGITTLYTRRSLVVGRSNKPAELCPRWNVRTVVAIGVAIATTGGGLLALTVLLFSNVYAAVFIATVVGVFIAASAYYAGSLGTWPEYLTRVGTAVGCSLLTGIWAGLCHSMLCVLVNCVLIEPQIANCAAHGINATIFIGLFPTTPIALLAVVAPKSK
jgi:hypothetical protein